MLGRRAAGAGNRLGVMHGVRNYPAERRLDWGGQCARPWHARRDLLAAGGGGERAAGPSTERRDQYVISEQIS